MEKIKIVEEAEKQYKELEEGRVKPKVKLAETMSGIKSEAMDTEAKNLYKEVYKRSQKL